MGQPYVAAVLFSVSRNFRLLPGDSARLLTQAVPHYGMNKLLASWQTLESKQI